MFFLGDQVQADSYNRQLATRGKDDRHVLPARLVRPVEGGITGSIPWAIGIRWSRCFAMPSKPGC